MIEWIGASALARMAESLRRSGEYWRYDRNELNALVAMLIGGIYIVGITTSTRRRRARTWAYHGATTNEARPW